MAFGRGPKLVKDGLVLMLDAANPKSYPGTGTTWNDLSGNGNNLQIINSPTFSNNSFTITTNEYFSASNNFMSTSGASNITYSFYINFNWGNVNGYKTIIGFQQDSFARVATFVLNTGTDELEFDLRHGGTLNRNIFNYNMSSFANTNCQVTYTFASGVHKLYINGNLVSTVTASLTTFPTWVAGSGGFAIGNNLDSARLLASGVFSNVTIYTKTLTASEVLQNYNATKSRFGL